MLAACVAVAAGCENALPKLDPTPPNSPAAGLLLLAAAAAAGATNAGVPKGDTAPNAGCDTTASGDRGADPGTDTDAGATPLGMVLETGVVLTAAWNVGAGVPDAAAAGSRGVDAGASNTGAAPPNLPKEGAETDLPKAGTVGVVPVDAATEYAGLRTPNTGAELVAGPAGSATEVAGPSNPKPLAPKSPAAAPEVAAPAELFCPIPAVAKLKAGELLTAPKGCWGVPNAVGLPKIEPMASGGGLVVTPKFGALAVLAKADVGKAALAPACQHREALEVTVISTQANTTISCSKADPASISASVNMTASSTKQLLKCRAIQNTVISHSPSLCVLSTSSYWVATLPHN